MTPTWYSDEPAPIAPNMGVLGGLRVAFRLPLLLIVLVFGLALLVLLRPLERLFTGARRPVTSNIARVTSRFALGIMGIAFHRRGTPLGGQGAVVVANHSSWLDIFALNAGKRITFVSKSEVAGWPGIGALAKATGTVFIERDRAQARAQTQMFRDKIADGERLLFFPEGTSTDGRRVLQFKSTLFAAFADSPDVLIQPVSVIYTAPEGQDERFYAWWGGMDFAPSLLKFLGADRGRVTVVYHPPVRVGDFNGRKAIAAALEKTVRDGVLENLRENVPEAQQTNQ